MKKAELGFVFVVCGTCFCSNVIGMSVERQPVSSNGAYILSVTSNIDEAIKYAKNSASVESMMLLCDFLGSSPESLKIAEQVLLRSFRRSNWQVTSAQQREINFLVARNYHGTLSQLSCFKKEDIVAPARCNEELRQLTKEDQEIVSRALKQTFIESCKTENARKVVRFLIEEN